MALGTAEPEAPKREDEIAEREAARFDPAAHQAKLEELRSHEAAVAARQGLNSTNEDSIQNQEEQGGGANYKDNFTEPEEQSNKGNILQRTFNNTKAAFTGTKKKGPTAIIVTFISMLLLGGATFFGGTLAPLMAIHNITDDLNDQLAALDIRTALHIKNKFKPFTSSDATSFGCSAVGSNLPIKCRFHTLSKREVNRLKAVGIEVDGETGGVFGNRIKPKTISFEGGDPIAAGDVAGALQSNRKLYNAMNRANNMRYIGLTGDTYVRKALGKFGLRMSAPDLEGSTSEERLKSLIKGGTSGSANKPIFRQLFEEDGVTPRDAYVIDGSSETEIYTKAQVDDILSEGGRFSVKPSLGKVSTNVLRGLNIVGWYDTACSIKNTVGSAAVAAKALNNSQLAGFSAPVAAMAGSMQAGHISPEDAQALQEFFNSTDPRPTLNGISGTSSDTLEAKEKPNPNYGKNAMDSELYKMSANGGVAVTSAYDKSYSLGFGATSMLEAAAKAASIGDAVLDADFIAGVSGCEFVQNTWVRIGGIGVGIVAAFFSGGSSAGVQLAMYVGAIALSIAVDNILNAALSNTLITDEMTITAVERGSAFWTGMAVLMGQSAQARGMMPGTKEQIIAYQVEQNQAKQSYIALEREQANPLDISNPYSVTGSVAYSLYDHIPTSAAGTNLTSISTDISSFVFSGLTSTLNPYTARAASLDPARFEQCEDEGYKKLGIDADVQCNVRYVMPSNSLNLDPIEVADYMEREGYVEPNTTTGLPKGYTPLSPDKTQSLAEGIIKGAKESIVASRDYGDDNEDPNQEGRYQMYGKFLDYCVNRVLPFGEVYEDPALFGDVGDDWKSGKNCLITDAPYNYFRAYTFDVSLDKDLEESPIVSEVNCGPSGSNSGGASGAKMSDTQIKEMIKEYTTYDPVAQTSDAYELHGGPVAGYEDMLKQLQDDPKAAWATQAMLNGEREWKATGEPIKEYLTSAWMWLENGTDKWPDPYQMNCLDEGQTNAARFCPSTASGQYQVAGFQVGDTKDKFKEVYDKLYEENELSSIMKDVVDNSTNASRDYWNYSDPANDSMKEHFDGDFSDTTMNDLWPAKPVYDVKAHIQSVILAKDPSMAAALNSFAVSDHDVVAMLQDCTSLGWSNNSYYCNPGLRLAVANMMYALYLFDGSGPSGGASCSDSGQRASGKGLGAIVEGNSNPENNFLAEWGNGLYGYGTQYGLNGTGHTGIDIGGARGASVFTPVSGTVRCAKTDNVECFAFNSYPQDLPHSPDTCTNFSTTEGTGLIEITLDNGHALILGHTLTSDVQVGQKVEAGQKVGSVGCMNGHHIHVEYRIPNSAMPSGWQIVDPEEYLGRG